jgi:hypothetical protein
MATIKITWKAFGESPIHNEYITSVQFDLDTNESHLDICERVFRDTNSYRGELWNIIEPLLSDKRTHTALSVGDEVEVNGTTYRCEGAGWLEVVSQ